ncbi:MAG: transglycosylase SLT domain-containing protein [Deltaproteobacteria bacterium]|nr:transglycosylase SLT domain-containing protein [Deltaproteobacteria bacterium]
MIPCLIPSRVSSSLFCLVVLAALLSYPAPAPAEFPILLKEIIIECNRKALDESLADGSYRGEAGILRIRPEPARSLGLKVCEDQDYREAVHLLEQAEKDLKMAKIALCSQRKETFPDQHARRVMEHMLAYQKTRHLSRERFACYHGKVNRGNDDRLDETRCQKVLSGLLAESLGNTGRNLRDALGYFFNKCQGAANNTDHLMPSNVAFVNEVFHRYARRAPPGFRDSLDLDSRKIPWDASPSRHWREVMEKDGFPYASHLAAALKRHPDLGKWVDPMLFAALMKRESRFDPLAVSQVGAAGLTQIMPRTALELGMKGIFIPSYYDRALSFMEKEKAKRREALETLFDITGGDGLQRAGRARDLMQASLGYRLQRERLLARYKRDLLRDGKDSRLDPAVSIEYGLRYFAGLMKDHQGDISLALASYNAGSHRVREYRGIPPFRETVRFRNRVLGFYGDYVGRLE